MTIQPSTLRILWTEIDAIPRHTLLRLSDTDLIALLLQHVSRRLRLAQDEQTPLYSYIGSKLTLIREIAASPSSNALILVS